VDVLLVPTVLQNFMIAEIEAEEKQSAQPTWTKNSLSGRFTNFVNLLDMAAISVPSALLRSEDLTDVAAKNGTPPPPPSHSLPLCMLVPF
jgi:Asp-tRNA(Asn)/Glu-tRNA(Gln) amidotransferase A subunit family amidase